MRAPPELERTGVSRRSSTARPIPLGSFRSPLTARTPPARPGDGRRRQSHARATPRFGAQPPVETPAAQARRHRSRPAHRRPPSRARIRLDPQTSRPPLGPAATGIEHPARGRLRTAGPAYGTRRPSPPCSTAATGPNSPSTDGLTAHQRSPPGPDAQAKDRLLDGTHETPRHQPQDPREQAPQQQAPTHPDREAPPDKGPLHGWTLSLPQRPPDTGPGPRGIGSFTERERPALNLRGWGVGRRYHGRAPEPPVPDPLATGGPSHPPSAGGMLEPSGVLTGARPRRCRARGLASSWLSPCSTLSLAAEAPGTETPSPISRVPGYHLFRPPHQIIKFAGVRGAQPLRGQRARGTGRLNPTPTLRAVARWLDGCPPERRGALPARRAA